MFNRKDIGASGNPKYAIAFKANIEIANVEVIDVVWKDMRDLVSDLRGYNVYRSMVPGMNYIQVNPEEK